MPKAGTMTIEEANAWAEALHADSAAGVFLGPAVTTAVSPT